MLNFLIDNIFVQCGGHVLQHLICIKIGTVRYEGDLIGSVVSFNSSSFGIDATKIVTESRIVQ
jgi:hypothetical protein